MLLGLALIMTAGLCAGWICRQIRFPALFGMILAGILIGPHALNLIDPTILEVSTDIRRIALIVILIRAGLKLDLSDLKKVGRPALLMCFLPACAEMLGMVLLAPRLLSISLLDAAILGAVVAAVSPAVVVPRMIRLIDEGWGTREGIPQMILAGASVDDVFVIVMFSTFTELARGGSVNAARFAAIPVSIVSGIAVGFAAGIALAIWFRAVKMPDAVRIVLILSLSFGLNTLEDTFSWLPFASLIAIMCIGCGIRRQDHGMAVMLSATFDKIWTIAELYLFVLVGASVAVGAALSAGPRAILLLFAVLVFRMLGVFLCLAGTGLGGREKLFCMIAYTPKATVQAAIGGLPLALGLPCGQIVLTVSVIAILLTAPLGAFGIDLTYRRFLHNDRDQDKSGQKIAAD